MDFVNQEYWDNSYSDISLDYSLLNDELTEFLEEHFFPVANVGSVFEIGCFPGRYLNIFGRKGYLLNGIDMTPRVKDDLPDYLRKKNYDVGSFACGDFMQFDESQKFDTVVSFGFIEHFENWDQVISKHIKLVKKGGYIVITVPNFSGKIQWLLHTIYDKNNLKRHNVKSMNTRLWLQKLNESNISYECIFAGPFGGFDFWVDNENRNTLKNWSLNKILKLAQKIKARKVKSKSIYSPYLGLIIKIK